ncbi:MAG: hypothetical protein WD823_03620 [Sulfuricaulis sp.]
MIIGNFNILGSSRCPTEANAKLIVDAYAPLLTHHVSNVKHRHFALLKLPTPKYLHLPVALNEIGEKLSKQTLAAPLDPARPLPALIPES